MLTLSVLAALCIHDVVVLVVVMADAAAEGISDTWPDGGSSKFDSHGGFLNESRAAAGDGACSQAGEHGVVLVRVVPPLHQLHMRVWGN